MKKQRKFISTALALLLVLQAFVFVSTTNVSAAGALRVQMYMGNTSSTTNTISPKFKIFNYGSNPLTMSSVKIRYYYTKDGSSAQNFVCNSNVSGITGNFVNMSSPTSDADNYLEISFPQGFSLAPSTSVELTAGISKSDGSNYDQTNDYSFNTINNYIDWCKVPAYILGNKLWGSEPDVNVGKRFLVIVSSKISEACSSNLNQYMTDLSNEGWAPTLIKVNNEQDNICNYVCPDAESLKEKIRSYYTQGYEGFVLIGSAPSIPCAFWKTNPSTSDTKAPSDLFYADMDDWTDISIDGVTDGIYESYYDNQGGISIPDYSRPANPSNPVFSPDMIYGRISAGAISDSDQSEVAKVNGYLSKIHDLRASGGQLSFDPKAFCFVDDEQLLHDELSVPSYLKDLERDIYSISNMISTNKNNFLQLLQGGYRIGYEVAHSSQTSWDIFSHPNGTDEDPVIEFPSIDDINNMTVKVNYLSINSCYACDYTTQNLGAAILFNNTESYNTSKNSYVYNITGTTSAATSYGDAQYFKDLGSESIGSSYKKYIQRHVIPILNGTSQIVQYPSYVLLGDPTIEYNFTKPTNKCPSVTNDLRYVNAYPNKPFKIYFRTTDPENDPVYLDIAGLPEGAVYDISTKTVDWVPQVSQARESYEVTATAYNKDALGVHINSNVQKFTIYVSGMSLVSQEIPNPGFESLNPNGTPSDWTTTIWSGELSLDPVVKNSGNYSARITGTGFYELSTNVEPNTDYLISGYVKTSNVVTTNGTGAYFTIHGNITIGSVDSPYVAGTQDWIPVYQHWNSGSNTSMKIRCLIDGSGTAWFDDFKLERDYNLGFEAPEQPLHPIDKWNIHSSNTNPFFTFRLDNEVMHYGLRSACIMSDQAPNYAYMTNDYPVEPSTEYRVSAWVKTQNIISGTVGANLAVISGTDVALSAGSVLDTKNEWTQIYVDFNSGNNTKATIYCRLGDASHYAQGTAWFDDVMVEKR